MSKSKPLPKINTTTPILPSTASLATSPGAPAGESSSPRRRTHSSRRSASFASPIEVLSKSPTARRMSQSTFSQAGTVLPEGMVGGGWRKAIEYPQVLVGTLIASIMFCGILYSLIFSTSLDTSLPSSRLTVDRPNAPYLARKSNLPNQVFVKYSWAWTTLLFLLHLISSPPSSTSRSSRLTAYGMSTLVWLVFTTWFFGAGLGDRLIASSGGLCAITIPTEWNLHPKSILHLFPHPEDIHIPVEHFSAEASTLAPSSSFLLPLPATFCSHRVALTTNTHPELFKALRSTLGPEVVSRIRMPRPRWHTGFDMSGHAFILTMATLLLTRELAPSWRSLLRPRQGRKPSGRAQPSQGSLGRGGAVHTLVTILGTTLVGMWLVMLGTTAVYFHNPQEKLSGLVLGLSVSTLISLLTPQSTSLFDNLPRALNPDSLETIAENENSARRGTVVDDGAIVDADVDEVLGHPKSE